MAEDHKVSPPKPENLHKSPKASEVALIFQHVWTSDWPIASSDCLIFCDFLFAIPLWSHQLLVAALLSIWSQQLYHTMSDLLEIIICIVCQFILTFNFQSKKFTWLASFISLSSVMLPHFLIWAAPNCKKSNVQKCRSIVFRGGPRQLVFSFLFNNFNRSFPLAKSISNLINLNWYDYDPHYEIRGGEDAVTLCLKISCITCTKLYQRKHLLHKQNVKHLNTIKWMTNIGGNLEKNFPAPAPAVSSFEEMVATADGS